MTEFELEQQPPPVEQATLTGAGRSDITRWLWFQLACAVAISGLMWLAPVVPFPSWLSGATWILAFLFLPLAAFLVPTVRGIPKSKRKLVWQDVPTFLAGALLALTSGGAGSHFAQDRMQPTRAEIVAVEHRKHGRHVSCVLQKPDGQKISPDLDDHDGCAGGVGRGDVLSVRYDPKGALSPSVESGESGKSRERNALFGLLVSGAAVVFVGFGTWGAVRLRRKYRELYGV